jgi:hypothetical protein
MGLLEGLKGLAGVQSTTPSALALSLGSNSLGVGYTHILPTIALAFLEPEHHTPPLAPLVVVDVPATP